jgi:hypothetical protein
MTALSTLVSYVFRNTAHENKISYLQPQVVWISFYPLKSMTYSCVECNGTGEITQKPQCCLNRATFFNYTYSKLIKQQKEKYANRKRTAHTMC